MVTSPGSNENDYQYQLEQSQASPAGKLPVNSTAKRNNTQQ
jgi:hypothetical protein